MGRTQEKTCSTPATGGFCTDLIVELVQFFVRQLHPYFLFLLKNECDQSSAIFCLKTLTEVFRRMFFVYNRRAVDSKLPQRKTPRIGSSFVRLNCWEGGILFGTCCFWCISPLKSRGGGVNRASQIEYAHCHHVVLATVQKPSIKQPTITITFFALLLAMRTYPLSLTSTLTAYLNL